MCPAASWRPMRRWMLAVLACVPAVEAAHALRRQRLAVDPSSSKSAPRASMVFTPKSETVAGVHMLSHAPRGFQVPREAVAGVSGAQTPATPDGINGVFLLLHSCGESSADWFEMPEERSMVNSLLNRGFLVVAPDAEQAKNPANCWVPEVDAPRVSTALQQYRSSRGLGLLPLYGVGLSSGGVMLGQMAYYGAPFAGIHINGAPPSNVRAGMPPTSYVAMKADPLAKLADIKKTASDMKVLNIPVQIIEIDAKPLDEFERRVTALGFDAESVPGMVKMMELWGFQRMSEGQAYMGWNTADQFLGRLQLDPNFAPLLRSKDKLKGLFEELHVVEGVHGATAEKFEESIDFLLDPDHEKRQGAPKPTMAPSEAGSPLAIGRTCAHAFPVDKSGYASQRILTLPQSTLQLLEAQRSWVASEVDFLCACLKVRISDQPSAGLPVLTWRNRTTSFLRAPRPGKPGVTIGDAHDMLCGSLEAAAECAQCAQWDPTGSKKK